MDTHSTDDFSWIPSLRPAPKPRKALPDQSWKPRYEAAYQRNFRETNAEAFKHSGYVKTTFPDTSKANGLTQAIIKFILWEGWNADRTGTQGRMIKDGSGWKRIHASNRKGTADIAATIRGRSVKLEVKVGRDKPSPEQLREQEREQRAGGIYSFIHNMQEFYTLYDSL